MAKFLTNWRCVDIEDIYKIHQRIIRRAQTRASVRDFSLLHSAAERPRATFSSRELYPTVFSKAAALLQSLCLNHPFTDGNKRTAWSAAHHFLQLNGYHLRANRDEAADFMVHVDNGKPRLIEIASWLRKHSTKG